MRKQKGFGAEIYRAVGKLLGRIMRKQKGLRAAYAWMNSGRKWVKAGRAWMKVGRKWMKVRRKNIKRI